MEILSDAEMLRYNRQIILKQFDFEGQEALKQSSILVLGAGGCLLYTSDAADD